ncbi:MAG: sulfatase, partial [Planctomycetota bacterium]
MNIRLKLVIAGLCFLSGGNTCADERPNILFVLTEDQGAHLSLLGTPGLKTPHIDSLANSGVYFSNAFVTYPVCSASKAAMYTGLHGHTNGILNNTHNFHKPASRVTKAEQNLWLARNNRIRDPFLTLTEILKANGYYQGVTHKLHVLPNEKFPYDEFLHGSRSELENFITNATNRDQPWFLMVNLPNSHRPFPNSDKNPIRVRPSEVRLPRFLPDSSAVRRDWAEYLAGIEQADALTGRTLEVLERCGQQDNTIVFFMSDHGPAFQHGKMTLYDLGLRVPLIVSGPGIAQTLVRDELVSELDLLPTILQLCGIDPPFDYSLHGQSIERLLTSDTAAKGHEYLFAEISNRGPLPNDGIQERSVFDGRWKLIYRENVGKAWRQVNADSRQFETWGNRTYDETIRLRDECPEAFRILAEMDPQNLGAEVPEVEVYDLEFDPDEIRNLAAEPSAAPIRNRLIAALRSWAKETKDTSISLVSFQEDESHTVASPEVAAAEVATAEVAVQDFDELKKQLTRQWPNNRLVRFVFHGHSVPAGYFRGGKVRRFDSYPVLFHQQLCDAYPTSVIDVCTTAIG